MLALSSLTVRRHNARGRGFTLLEMLAVIVLIALVGALVVTQVAKHVDENKWNLGKAGVQKLANEITDYEMDNGSPPPVLQDLLTKPANAPAWNGPYAKAADLIDPFGHKYAYIYPGRHGRYDIVFYGRDGKPGGTGLDRDYGNWQ